MRSQRRRAEAAAVDECDDNEPEVGIAFKECFEEGLVNREELFITSKLWVTNFAPDDVKPALEKQLKDLCLDYLDLYLFHWPVAKTKDNDLLLIDLDRTRQISLKEYFAIFVHFHTSIVTYF